MIELTEFQKDFLKVFFKSFENEDIKIFAQNVVAKLPDYWWTVNASSSGKYHPAYVMPPSGGGLFISDYLIYGSYIYIVIYINESRSIVAHYDFDLNEITVVGKALNGFWDYTLRAFYLENEVCLPSETLIEK